MAVFFRLLEGGLFPFRIISICWLVLFCLTIHPSFAAEDGYLINRGDRLEVDVWQEENLHAEVVVAPDGTFSFPMIGVVTAAGKTVEQLQTLLKERFEEYIPGPEVVVSLKAVEGNLIYVTGEVTRSGPYVMTNNLDVMQAISMAGGLTAFASKNNIRILRRNAEGQSTSIPFSYGDVEDGENPDTNILLKSGDTIIVP